jgi:tetratricopeptide (TPR) repeat protein
MSLSAPRALRAVIVPFGLALALLLAGCDREPTAPGADRTPDAAPPPPVASAGSLTITYPQDGTLFPPDIVAPTLVWQDTTEHVDRWSVVVRDDAGAELLRTTVEAKSFRPSEDDWRRIKAQSAERDAEILVAGVNRLQPETVRSSARIRIRTSKDPVNDALFYREVPLPFLEAVQDPSRIRWRYGTVDMEDGPPIVLQNLPVCGNCHSFADDGRTLGLDVDYGNDKGAYAIMDVAKHMVMDDAKIITWADFRREDGELTFGLLSRVSPTGRYVVSTVKDRSVFVALPDLMMSQLFFPIKGILVVYDREMKTFKELPGADDPRYVQSNPVWSPDGKEIVFARATAYAADKLIQQNNALLDEKDVPEFTVQKKPFRYDLYRIPFNDGRGGVAEPIPGASGDGRSNYFPKYSPDGKWIVFCKANSYMLLQLDSELWIMPAQGGEARRLRYNTPRMNSWHSWSSNSRWLVFSSKVNGPYTQLFLTHIDDEGNDSPPVLLERFTSTDRAANIPEFVRQPGDAIAEIKEQFLDAYSFLRAGMANERTGDHKGAERAFRRGLEIAPDNAEIHNALGWTLFQDGRPAEAVPEYLRAIELDPKSAKAHNNVALAFVELGRLDEAEQHFRTSLAIEPKAEIHSDLGFVLARQGKADEAQAQFAKALALDPDCPSAHFNMGVIAVQRGALDEAEAHYRKALPNRDTAETHNGLGFVLARQGRDDEAIAEFRAAIALDERFTPAWNNLGEALARKGLLEEAAEAYGTSIAQRPTPGAHNALGAVLKRLGRTADANREFQKGRALAAGG